MKRELTVFLCVAGLKGPRLRMVREFLYPPFRSLIIWGKGSQSSLKFLLLRNLLLPSFCLLKA